MIVGFQPGGTIRHARVVLRFGELLPRKFNNEATEVHMEGEHTPLPWMLIKSTNQVLPEDSPYLSQPELAPVDILDLTKNSEHGSFDHTDIIRLDEKEEKDEQSSDTRHNQVVAG